MNTSTNNVQDLCEDRYREILANHLSKDGAIEIVGRVGEFSQDYVNQVSEELEERLLESGERKVVVKKMFSIVVEALQNIRLHGEKDAQGNNVCFFTVLRNDTHYFVYIGNLLLNLNRAKIEKRVDDINDMTKDEVKEFYLKVLTDGVISSKGGAGLGFITMAMKSLNELEKSFIDVDDRICFYDLRVTVDRVKE